MSALIRLTAVRGAMAVGILTTVVVLMLAAGDESERAATAGTDAINRPAGAVDTATFAGGCFWCMEPPFDSVSGVHSVTSGYTGGSVPNPTYEQVTSGRTGHAEAVQIIFDSTQVTYARLLDIFWHNIDPLTANAQFCDVGTQYRSAIFHQGDEQRRQALETRRKVQERFGKPVVTEIVPAPAFYAAEEYHQRYYRKNPVRYKVYRWNCGRDRRLRELWGDAAGKGTMSGGEVTP